MTTPIALTTRSSISAPLSWAQMDANWTAIQSAINALLAGGAGSATPWVSISKYFTAAQIAGCTGTGPFVDCSDAIDLAIADIGDVTWQGSMLNSRPSRPQGGMKSGGVVVFPPWVIPISRTIYQPPGVTFWSPSGTGGFFASRPNNNVTANGNAANVKRATLLCNFPAGSGVGQAGQMWAIDTATWVNLGTPVGGVWPDVPGSVRRPLFNECFTGADFDNGHITSTPGISVIGIDITSVRDPSTGFHIAAQIPYGGIRLINGVNAHIANVGVAGVDFGILVNASWGYTIDHVFGYAFLGGLAHVNDVNASGVRCIYINRDNTLDATTPRSITNTNRFTALAAGTFGVAAGLPMDFTNMRFGQYVSYPTSLHIDSSVHESWDIPLAVNQVTYGALNVTNFHEEASSVAPIAAVTWLGSINGFQSQGAASQFGYCWGLNCSLSCQDMTPRRMHVQPYSVDPNRNLRFHIGLPDLYTNILGGRSANMFSWSNDCTQGVTLTNMTSTAYSANAVDQSFTAGTITASGAGVASLMKSGAACAPITGTNISGVDYTTHAYCYSEMLKWVSGATTSAMQIAFSGGSTAVSAKGVITWAAGVPTLTLSGNASVTGFVESKGEGWYKINISCNSDGSVGLPLASHNTSITTSLFVGDGTTSVVGVLYVGNRELSPTLFPLQAIYNLSATVPNPGPTADGTSGGEHWEWYDGIDYVGANMTNIRVSASGNPNLLGQPSGLVATGDYTTLDAAIYRISKSKDVAWEISVHGGDSVVLTANSNGWKLRNKRIHIDEDGGDAGTGQWNLQSILTPANQASAFFVEGDSSIIIENAANIKLPNSASLSATACGLVYLSDGNASNVVTVGIRNSTLVELYANAAIVQQGNASVNDLKMLLNNVTAIHGTGTACLHASGPSSANSQTKVSQTSRNVAFTGSVVSAFAANGYVNAVSSATALA